RGVGLRGLGLAVGAGAEAPVAAGTDRPPESPHRGLFDGLAGDAAEPVGGYDVGDFAFGANAATDDWQAKYELVDTEKKFAAFLKKLKKQKRFAVDLETTGLDPLQSELVGLAFSWQDGSAYYLPVRAPENEKHLDEAEGIGALRGPLEDPAVGKVNQNIKFDLLVFRRLGVRARGVAGDSMVADYLLRAGERSHNLDELAQRHLGHTNIAITDLIGKKGKQQKTLDQVPTARVRDYAAEDADVAWRLTEKLEAELAAQPLRPLYDRLEVPLIDVLAELECNGVRLDVPFLGRLSAQMTEQLATIEKEIYGLAGHPFNIASLKQLRTVL